MSRIILFTGKGGVGKTTVAAATAIRLADEGFRVAITSADPAHSLADAFDRPLGSDLRTVVAGCDAQQLDARERLEDGWAEIREWILGVLDRVGVGAIEAEEIAVLPGLDELVALAEIESLSRSGSYDVVIVDCAPTAETLRLLSLPDLLAWYLRRVHPVARRLNRVVGPVLTRFTSVPAPDDAVFDAGERFTQRLERVHRLLADPEVTSVRLVVNPERMVLAEARRTYAYLSLFGFQVDAVVANRVLPAEVGDEFFDRWREDQRELLETIESDFGPLPVFRVDLAHREVVGTGALRSMGKALWDGIDASARLVDHRPWRVERRGGDLVLAIDLPMVDREDVGVAQSGADLVVTVGPHRRTLAMPDSLARRSVSRAVLDSGVLRVTFIGPESLGAEAPGRQ